MAYGKNYHMYLNWFRKADVNGDGQLTKPEIKNFFNRMGSRLNDRLMSANFTFVQDPKGDEVINFEEFSAGLARLNKYKAQLEEMFKQADRNGDGQLTKKELKPLLKKLGDYYSARELDTLFREADRDGDNKLSYEEFISSCT